MDQLLARLRTIAEGQKAELRILTGLSDEVSIATARYANRLEIPLHLISLEQPRTLADQKAERVVWLGTGDPKNEDALAIRNDVALAFSDMLVLLWDGQAPHEHSQEAVRLAMHAALGMEPILWLVPDGSVRMLDRSRLDTPYRHKLRAPHPRYEWLLDLFTEPLDEMTYSRILSETFSLILDPSPIVSDLGENVRVEDYRSQPSPIRSGRAGHLHEAMMSLVRGDWTRFVKQFSSRLPQPYWGPAKADSLPSAPRIEACFERFDVSASVAAGRHRDASWIIYWTSAMAVLAAVAGAIGLWPGGHNAFWSVAEVLLIAIIITVVVYAKRCRWHEIWIGHRFLAEQLRYARVCLPLLGVSRPFLEPAWRAEKGRLYLENTELWYLQRTLVAEGFPVGSDGVAYVPCNDASVVRMAEYLRTVVEDQHAYHHRNHHKLHLVHERIAHFSNGLFIATILAVLGHFVLHAEWLLICTAFFPALAAALHGLATKLEITRIAGQSAAMERELGDLAAAIAEAGNYHDWEGWVRLRQLALEASRVMSDENGQWQQLIRHQETELPA
ncbi:MAG: hypothetical protein HQL64_16820 [Magnetococcales bacterium]|nr:hypothetical protein [Magnetococcales bacterium]